MVTGMGEKEQKQIIQKWSGIVTFATFCLSFCSRLQHFGFTFENYGFMGGSGREFSDKKNQDRHADVQQIQFCAVYLEFVHKFSAERRESNRDP